MDILNKNELIGKLPSVQNYEEAVSMLNNMIKSQNKKIFVLDDDPTGVQTVNNIPVYTSWDEVYIRSAFNEKENLIYILTNSRGLLALGAESVNRVITERICKISKETGISFSIISRSDSTLRGHYPLETEAIREIIEENSNIKIDGEVILPFFKEGGRYTYNDVHYVEENGQLVPAGQTEFAKDNTFGYTNSDLKLWVEEKTNGQYKHYDVISISLDMIRKEGYEHIAQVLSKAQNFQKIIVNAFDYADLYIFTAGLLLAEDMGKNFLFRTAAAFVKVRGGVGDRPLLTKEDLVKNNGNGGLILVGSHVAKTTRQLNHAMEIETLKTVELKVARIITDERDDEVKRVLSIVEKEITSGNSILVYTTREVVKAKNEKSEDNLEISIRVSEALVDIVKLLKEVPRYIIAKGGITSSDIGTKGLGVKRALVAGQIKPGIPVWITDNTSKFPELPYVIFPGNVGNDYTLKEIISDLQGNK